MNFPWPHFIAGFTLAICGWLAPRAVAGAWRWRPFEILLVDAAAPFVCFVALTLEIARPISAGTLVLLIFGGFAIADALKRRILREPVVFTDLSEVIELLRHPELYLPFVGTGRVILGAAAGLAIAVVLVASEPTAFAWSFWLMMLALVASLGTIPLLAGPLLAFSARRLRRFSPTGDAAADARRLGSFAMLGAHGLIARDERAARRTAAAPAAARSAPIGAPRPPLVVVQSESFFDARRMHPSVSRNLLPAFDACRDGARQWGRLAVPTWGAETPRTEFAVLSSLPAEALGFDRFNPYHAFARAPLASLASRLRAEGYRTICVHPFDRRFYRRDIIMPYLGFDLFFGDEAFAGAERSGGYVSDGALADFCVELLRENKGEGVFIFAITMENHGPWSLATPSAADRALAPGLGGKSEAAALANFLRGLRSSDAMLFRLRDALVRLDQPGVLAFYGDHLPSMPSLFESLGFTETDTDYLIWGPPTPPAKRVDLSACELGAAIIEALQATVRPTIGATLASGGPRGLDLNKNFV